MMLHVPNTWACISDSVVYKRVLSVQLLICMLALIVSVPSSGMLDGELDLFYFSLFVYTYMDVNPGT